MNIVSLFAGCGGLDLGFERAGFNVKWANEFDNTIHDTYRYNHPKTTLNTSDIRDLDVSDIPDCDGIIGGPPCQSWSVGGKFLGIEDERGKLVYDYIRIVKGKQPKFFIMENVPGMITPRHFDAFQSFLDLFREAGYRLKYELMDAQDFKIPQERLRLIIVGIRNDLENEFFFPPHQTTEKITLERAIGDLIKKPKPYKDEEVIESDMDILNNEYYAGDYDKKYMARNRVRGWDEVSFTIQAKAMNAPIHPSAPKMVYVSQDKRIFAPGREHLYRRLSVRECARIQTFPDTFKFIYKNIKDGYKMIGNAVPPRLAYYLALSIKQCLINNQSVGKKVVENVLVGYVKSDADFEIVNTKRVYYIRGGNRPGAMQFGQVSKPIQLLLLHRQNRKELYILQTGIAEKCSKNTLTDLGFHPRGDEYWMYTIKEHVSDSILIDKIVKTANQLSVYPQIIGISN